MQTELDQVNSILAFYEEIGFKRQNNPLYPQDDLNDPLQAVRNCGQALDCSNWFLDLAILHMYFSGDAWMEDTECDVCEENEVYTDVLQEWSDISQGAFLPQNITESWESDEGPIKVTFILNSVKREIEPKWDEDWLDMDVLDQINEIIAGSGRSFEISTPDQNVMVLCLTPEQKARMIKERDFPFTERIIERVAAQQPLVRQVL
ncbi:MAG TPA: hypothetical protein V6C76_12780 [Drouetiella sp.]